MFESSYNKKNKVPPETHIIWYRRPSTAACPAGGWGQRNLNSVRLGKNILYWADYRVAMAEQKFLYLHDNPNEPTKKGPLSFVLFESPFTWFSTVSRGHPSLVSLDTPHQHLEYLGGISQARLEDVLCQSSALSFRNMDRRLSPTAYTWSRGHCVHFGCMECPLLQEHGPKAVPHNIHLE